VLSEALAFEACAALSNVILEKHGISDRYTGQQLLSEFVGQNFRGMLTNLCNKYGFQLSEDEMNKYVLEEEDWVIAKLKEKAQPCDGCNEELAKTYDSGKYMFAVVSSSAHRRVLASVIKANQAQWFLPDKIFSAATSLPKPTSKPDPAIYKFACEKLGVQPAECIAVEDSKSGALSAIRAGIPVLGYVGSYETHEKQAEMRSALKDLGCQEIMGSWSEFQGLLEKMVVPRL
jgi:HAD superfamily hydrolase (TIGR01509 family)